MRSLATTLFLQAVKQQALSAECPHNICGEDDAWYEARGDHIEVLDLAIKHYSTYDDLTSTELKDVLGLIEVEFGAIKSYLKEYVERAEQKEDPDRIPF